MNNKCLMLVFGKELSVLYFDSCPGTFEDLAGDVFTSFYSDNDNGFYDWLRCESGDIVGVEWFPYKEDILNNERIRQCVGSFKNIIFNSMSVRIYFRGDQVVSEDKSCDQSFGENNLFFSTTGKCAISFSTWDFVGGESAHLTV